MTTESRACRRSIPPFGCSLSRQCGFRRLFAFMGPGYMVSVGYMDPGNWATDLQGGASLRLHASLHHHAFQPDGDPAASAGGPPRDRDRTRSGTGLPRPLFPKPGELRVCGSLARLAIMACDLAEVIGTAIALQLAVRHSAASLAPDPDGLDAILLLYC